MPHKDTAQALSLFAQICSTLNAVQFKLNAFIADQLRDPMKADDVINTKRLVNELNLASDKACFAYDAKNVDLLKSILACVIAKTNVQPEGNKNDHFTMFGESPCFLVSSSSSGKTAASSL